MATAAEVKVYFTGDTSNLEGATQKANGMFDGMLGGLTKFGAIAGVGALAAGAFGAAATMAAADVAESQNKVNVVFGESKGAIEELASTAAASLGQTRGQVLEAAGTFGNLLTALGMTKDGAADMSVDMVKLASDLASFNNSDPTEVLEALRSGLTGEAEPMKRFGVALNEVAMKQAAMKAGLGDNVAALSEAEKMQLRYNIIMEQTKTAQGDFANTSDGMANSLRIIKASMSDAVAEMGDRLLPAIQPLVSGFADALPGAMNIAMGLFDQLTGKGSLIGDTLASVSGFVATFMAGFNSSPDASFLDKLVAGFSGVGLNIQPVIDAVLLFKAKLDEVVAAAGPWIDKLNEIVPIGNIVAAMIGVALVLAFGALAVAAGSAAIGVVTAMAPILIPIAAIGLAVAALKAIWDNNWGGIQEKVAGVVKWIQDNVLPIFNSVFAAIPGIIKSTLDWITTNLVPTLTVIFNTAKDVLSGVAGFFMEHMDQIVGILRGGWDIVSGLFSGAFALIKGIVTAALALIRGDFTGAGNAIQDGVRGAVNGIAKILGGLVSIFVNALKMVVGAIGPTVSTIGHAIIDGIVGILKGGASLVWGAIKGVVGGLIDIVKSMLGIASPSKVFEEIGMWITLGLASGIQKEDQKAIAALAAVIQSMNSVIGGVQDFASKLLKFVVPSDTQLSEMKGKYVQMLVIVSNFAKDMSYLGSLVGPSTPNISFAAPGQIATINQGLAELASTLPAVKELQGLRAEDLLTGGEASWVTGLTDIIGKVASSWGSLADNLTKMSAAKMPSAEAIQTLKESAVRIIVWAQDVTKLAPPNPVGLDDFAQTVKSAADMLATVAKLNLGEVVALAENNLTTAASNADKLARAAVPLALAFAAAAGTGEQRADLVKAVSEYASVVKSSADILTSGATDKLAEATALDATRLDAAARNTTSMLTAVVGLALDFQRAAGTEAQGATLLTGVKLYADTVKAAGDALAAGAALALADATDVDLMQLDIATTNAAEMVKAVTLLSTAFRSMAEEAQAELASGTKLYAEVVKAAGDVLGAGGSLALAEATDVDLTQLDIAEANAALMYTSVKSLSETFRKLAEDARKDLADGAKQYADVIKAAADVLGLGAALDLRDAVAFEWNLLPFIEETVTAVYDVVVRLSEKFRQLGGEDQTNLASGAKLYADIIKAAADMLKAGASVDLKNAVTFEWNMLGFVEEAVAAMFDSIVRMAEKFTQDNNGTAQKAIVEGAKNFAATVTAAASLFGSVADAVAKLGELTNPGDLTAKLDIVRGWITIIWDQLKMIAVDITKDEAEAKAAVASAIGSAAKGLGDIGDGIGKLMSMATGGLFGADSKRGDIGFMQAVRGRRADFNASVLTDSIKRMVKALTDALSGLDLPSPDDPRVAAIAALGDAFGKLADGIDKLATVKIPDARRMAELMAIAAQGSLIPGAGLTVGAGGGGTTTINNYNTVNGGVTIVAPDQPSFTSLIAGLGAWRIR